MLSYRKNIIISFTFIMLLGAFCIYESISILFDPESVEKGYILINQTNLLIKYSPSLSLGYAGVIFLIYPILVVKNFMSLGENFLVANERLKAKMKLAAYTLFSPTILFFISSVLFSKDINNRPLLIVLTLCGAIYGIAKNTYVCYLKKTQ